jgi:hypothetical protein
MSSDYTQAAAQIMTDRSQAARTEKRKYDHTEASGSQEHAHTHEQEATRSESVDAQGRE